MAANERARGTVLTIAAVRVLYPPRCTRQGAVPRRQVLRSNTPGKTREL